MAMLNLEKLIIPGTWYVYTATLVFRWLIEDITVDYVRVVRGRTRSASFLPLQRRWFLNDDLVDGWSKISPVKFAVVADCVALYGDAE